MSHDINHVNEETSFQGSWCSSWYNASLSTSKKQEMDQETGIKTVTLSTGGGALALVQKDILNQGLALNGFCRVCGKGPW